MVIIIAKTFQTSFENKNLGAVVRTLAFHYCGPGLIPGLSVICGLSLLLVLVLAPRGFSPCTPIFPSPQKPTVQFDLESDGHRSVSRNRLLSVTLVKQTNKVDFLFLNF